MHLCQSRKIILCTCTVAIVTKLCELSYFILIDTGAYQEIPDESEGSASPQVDVQVCQFRAGFDHCFSSQLEFDNCNVRIIVVRKLLNNISKMQNYIDCYFSLLT